jgi:uncharacterized protein YbjT (DUF2867 family)
MLHLLVLGAAGGVGREVVSQAIGRGDAVTAFVRRAGALVPHPSLTIVTGSLPADAAALRAAASGQDAVISALGVGKSFKSRDLIASSMPAILDAMRAGGVRRFVHTSAFGVGPTWPDTPFVPRLFIRTLLRDIYRDKAAGEAVLEQSGVDWTVLHPTGLTDKPGRGAWAMGERLPLRGFPTIARADVAACLLSLVDDPATVGKHLLVTSETA